MSIAVGTGKVPMPPSSGMLALSSHSELEEGTGKLVLGQKQLTAGASLFLAERNDRCSSSTALQYAL